MTEPEEALTERVATLPDWYHSIDLGHGVWTPGRWSRESRQPLRDLLTNVDFKGAKVLDVGCLDGLWTFEAERRGAVTVHAIDVLAEQSGRAEYFRLAAELCGSRAHYWPDLSVYDVADIGVNDFDVVVFFGVYYHLRHPLLALESLRAVMAEGSIIVIEGQVTGDERVSAEFYHRRVFESDSSNWWVPTIPCLHEWVESSGFVIEGEHTWTSAIGLASGLERAARHALVARSATIEGSSAQPRPVRTRAALVSGPAPGDQQETEDVDGAGRLLAFLSEGTAALRDESRCDLPLPPPSLVRRVTGSEDLNLFDEAGAVHLQWLLSSAATAGRVPEPGARVLDFGCGCGRILRHLINQGRFEVTGVDIDEPAVAWVRGHLPDVAAHSIGAIPPTELPAGAFDLIIAYSVFTHLDEDHQNAWLSELFRLAAPGATVLATIHGPAAWERHATASAMADDPELSLLRKRWAEEGFAFWSNDGWEQFFPGWYHTAFHRPDYVEERWRRWFDVVKIVPSPTPFDQDLVILAVR